MAPVTVDPDKVREFSTEASFHKWLGKHHDKESEVWIKIHKVGSGLKSITPKEAIDVILCWGWIDGIRKGFDDRSFLQRYTPRGAKSVWSQINIDNVARLVAEGRMTGHGLKHVDAAKQDGRWDRAYLTKGSKLPDDLLAATGAEPEAKTGLVKLSAQSRCALAFRNMKIDVGRKKNSGPSSRCRSAARRSIRGPRNDPVVLILGGSLACSVSQEARGPRRPSGPARAVDGSTSSDLFWG